MNQLNILKTVILKGHHMPTGKTLHFRFGEVVPCPYSLRICQFEGDDGYYLLYYDKNDFELTDTYHETIEEAMRQANFEFNVKEDEWRDESNSIG